MVVLQQLWDLREKVRQERPLVYNLTNNVVTNVTANILLATGARPIMSEGAAEAEALARAADALVLNIGTLHTRQITYFLKAGSYANEYGKPVVLDPVGVGATPYRDITVKQLLGELKMTLIRGNYGEISYLAGSGGIVNGVDTASTELPLESFKKFSVATGAIVAATGKTDYVTDGQMLLASQTGHEWLQYVTGTGCALTSLMAAFTAVAQEETLLAATAAVAFYGAAAEKAAAKSKGPGSFGVKFIDALYNLDFKDFRHYCAGKVQPAYEDSAKTAVEDEPQADESEAAVDEKWMED
ncbi:hydroxyethylthiazole kinase [Anaeromusa acidaminophila]|uniref:hydroxyethylthiazole kinase n=1 Tax=Sporomusaceae TaxID=1843490 RepID=UPI0012DF4668